MERLFSYGTLRLPEVQLALFDRVVSTIDDVLPGFRLDTVRITDPDVIAKSGSDVHPILRRSGDEDSVPGAYLELSARDLVAADEYEVDDYRRARVVLGSRLDAWVYLAADEA